VNWKFCIIK